MSSKSNKPQNTGIPVWLSPVEETQYEPARILAYDDVDLVIRSAIYYTAGQKILIGIDFPHKRNGGCRIEALLKARIFLSRQIEIKDNCFYEYRAKFLLPDFRS